MKAPIIHRFVAISTCLLSASFAQKIITLTPEETKEVAQLGKERQHLNKTLWASENQAQAFEKAFLVPFWNKLLKSKPEDRFSVLANISFQELLFPQKLTSTKLALEIHEHSFGGKPQHMSQAEWQSFAHGWKHKHYLIEHTDWHQASFTPDKTTPISEVNFRIQVRNTQSSQLAEINGTLAIHWAGPTPDKNGAKPAKIVIKTFTLRERTAKPIFEESLHVDDKAFGRTGYIIPATVVYDFNNDGLPEILQGSVGGIFWNKGDFKFEVVPYTKNQETLLDAAVVEDFNGDGLPDLLGVTSQKKLALFTGIERGSGASPFKQQVLIFDAPGDGLHSTCTLTTGDADGDGDLDVWIGQWKSPYHVMPKRYYDANDGHASFLLLNDGNGNFTDGTEASGLGIRRFRRSYSGSFVDLDDDGDQDLITVNDFAGVDAYHNDGKGHFTLVSDKIIDEWHTFGMSHTMGDYNSDGRLDFYVQGMSSTTARRLDRMKVGPNELKDLTKMRRIMGYGNRMYLAKKDHHYQQPIFKDSVARTGWSWGSTSLDFDNDGHLDIFIANGHISGKSTQDHCTNFWCHEIYLPQQRMKKNSQKAIMSFLNESLGTPEISWDGYQPNRFFRNLGGKGFVEISYLIGAGHVTDSRTAISADFNADGHRDLLFGYQDYRTDISHIQLLRNTGATSDSHHWIGVHLRSKPGISAIGAKVTATAGNRTFIARQINGDSYQSQHPDTQHFGLGTTDKIDTLQVRWANGKTTTIHQPKVDQYHIVTP